MLDPSAAHLDILSPCENKGFTAGEHDDVSRSWLLGVSEQTRIILGEELLRIQEALGQTIFFITHNIQEAILLPDRMIVLSARPGKIKAVVPVDFPRPRDCTLLASDRFTELVGEVWSVLREESLKGFEQVEGAGEEESDA